MFKLFLDDAFATLPGLILCWMLAPDFICLALIPIADMCLSSDYGDANDIDRLDFLDRVLRQITC